MKRNIVFRADGNSEIGLGHIFRVSGLSQKLNNFRRVLYTNNDIGFLKNDSNEFFDEVNVTKDQQESNWIDHLNGSEIVVLDGYHFGQEVQLGIKKKGCFLLMIDDIHDQFFFADAIINTGGEDLAYLYQTEFYTQFYFGFRYAILRNAFYNEIKETLKKDSFHTTDSLFICLGGADPENKTMQVLNDVYNSYGQIKVVVSNAYRHLKEIEQFGLNYPHIEIYKNISETEMSSLMRSTSVGICSASTVAYEYLSTGGKLLLLMTADNQKHIYKYLIDSEVAIPYGNQNLIAEVSFKKVKDFLHPVLETNYSDIFSYFSLEMSCCLCLANLSHMQLYFNWSNDKEVRNQSYNQDPVKWEDHVKWFAHRLADPGCKMYLMTINQIPVGQLRMQIHDSKTALINYSIGSEWRGKGLARIVIKLAVIRAKQDHPGIVTFKGYVKKENKASQKAFLKNKFVESETEDVKNSFLYTLKC